jgi:CRISPR-associated protein Csh1
MSLAYKLWKIGEALTDEDILATVREQPQFKEEPAYLCIDFSVNGNRVNGYELKKDAINADKLFMTSKMGGSGSGIYYLYPNLALQDDPPLKKFNLLKNTLEKGVLPLLPEKGKEAIQAVVTFVNDKEMFAPVKQQLDQQDKFTGFFWIEINGSTIYEKAPEVWSNWLACPAVPLEIQTTSKDAVSNAVTEVGYRTEFKIFSYDQYHDSLNHRLNANFPVSKQSARAIKLAWIFILKNLVFYYKGLEYLMLPNLLVDNSDCLRQILKRLTNANISSNNKRTILERLYNQEKKVQKDLAKLGKGKNQERLRLLQEQMTENRHEILNTDLGLVEEINEQFGCLDELRNMITVDMVFTSINRTNLSFEIKGSISDVVPSRVSEVVLALKECNISDLVTLKGVNYDKTRLQDFFAREELALVRSRSANNYKNKILSERLALARLMLTDQKIRMDDLMQRFQYNREFDYTRKRRVTMEGVKKWVAYPENYTNSEDAILRFFSSLNKIQE